MTDLVNKVIWITGASSGIGKALAKTAAQQNTKLILSGRRVDALEALATELSVDCLVLPFEVTDYDVLASKVDEAWAWQGRVDILVNNAGISQRFFNDTATTEIYTEAYAVAHANGDFEATLSAFVDTAVAANEAGLGVNAGHDVNLDNLPDFKIPHLLEVSIGHALTVDALRYGFTESVRRYCRALELRVAGD